MFQAYRPGPNHCTTKSFSHRIFASRVDRCVPKGIGAEYVGSLFDWVNGEIFEALEPKTPIAWRNVPETAALATETGCDYDAATDMIAAYILITLAVLSLVLTLWQWLVARAFPLHRRLPSADLPDTPVTLLKPLRGVESATPECLRSWFTQRHSGSVQLLFGVAAAGDPVVPVVKELIREFPKHDAELVICPERLGPNAKVSTLVQLFRQAKHERIVISDADVRAPHDLLENLVATLSDPNVGLATCFYSLANPANLAMRWEAIAINCDFWSQVLQSKSLRPLQFALGAVMATRKVNIAEIGGLDVLLNYLADDYHLGRCIAQRSHEIRLCPVVVECWSSPQTWAAVWTHQLRWARTIRVSEPLPYFFSILNNATLWPLLACFVSPHLYALAAGCLLFRAFSAYDQYRRLVRSRPSWRSLVLVWLKDLLNAAIWLLAFLGNRVTWRGERFRVLPGGKLERMN